MDNIRVWSQFDIKEIEKHLVIVDDLHGFCESCKHAGIKYDEINNCPSCGTEFKYVATREKISNPSSSKILKKIFKNLPDLKVIDYYDYNHIKDKTKANDLFGNL